MDNKGKAFETKFKQDFIKSFPDGTIDRIYDTVNGLKSISNISDFISYNFPHIFYLECKTHKGASLPIANITQYEKLVNKVGIKGVRSGVVVWLYEKDLVFYCPISTITKLLDDGKKSVGIKAIEEGYNIKVLPSIKKRVFMDTDYTPLMDLVDGE